MQGAPFKFDQNNEMHRKAQYYLETMDREKFPTFGDVMVAAIVDYFDRYYAEDQEGAIDAPAGAEPAAGDAAVADANATDQFAEAGMYAESGAVDPAGGDLEAMVTRAVEQALDRKLPEIIGPLLEEYGLGAEKEKNEADLESVEKDINWGFLGG